MAQLINIDGTIVGYIEDNQEVPSGYWTRSDDAPNTLSPLEFLDSIGQSDFTAIWTAMLASPQLAYLVMRGFAAQEIRFTESYPQMRLLELSGILPQGSSQQIWHKVN